MSSRFVVRECRSLSEIRAVQRLRYEVYVEEMGRPQPHADHVNRRVVDALDATGTLLGIERDGSLVGTVRLNRVSDGVGAYRELYGLLELSAEEAARHGTATALMVHPSARRDACALGLFQAACAYALVHGVEICWLDCNPHLVSMFEGVGWTRVRPIRHPLYGDVHLMRVDLRDVAHHRAVRSALLPVLSNPLRFLPERSSAMSTMDRLRADFATVAARLHADPACARLLAGEATVKQYASFMASVALETRENPQIQAFATAFFRGGQRDLVRSFFKHAISEVGHDQLAADDVAALGYDTTDLLRQAPRPATVALTAFAYYTITHLNPVGYLGYLFFLEFLPTVFGAEYAAALDRIGVPPNARTFLYDHAKVDVGHNKLMERYVEDLVVDEATYEAVRYAMEVTGALYARMLQEAFERADELDHVRRPAPWEAVPTAAAPASVAAVA